MKVERLKGLPFNLTEEEAEEIFNEFSGNFSGNSYREDLRNLRRSEVEKTRGIFS